MNANMLTPRRRPSEVESRSEVSWSLILTGAIASASTYCVLRLVSRYGLEGAIWYVWEGSPYPPEIREGMETLNGVEAKMSVAKTHLINLEESLAAAQRNNAAKTFIEIRQQWEDQSGCKDLRLTLAQLSDDLDKMAASVDGVPSAGSKVVKDRKKSFSKELVRLMERADALISFYKSGNTQMGQ